jgi:hypothetical protein
LKHITHDFLNEWIDHLRKYFKKDFLCIGEYWQAEPGPLLKYIDATEGRMQLFDVPLHYNFHEASVSDNKFDMSKILHNTLVSHKPELSVTFVDNHDTQPLQALQIRNHCRLCNHPLTFGSSPWLTLSFCSGSKAFPAFFTQHCTKQNMLTKRTMRKFMWS